jgi:hypothetical protein
LWTTSCQGFFNSPTDLRTAYSQAISSPSVVPRRSRINSSVGTATATTQYFPTRSMPPTWSQTRRHWSRSRLVLMTFASATAWWRCLASPEPANTAVPVEKDPNFTLSQKVYTALQSLKTGLNATITRVHTAAPDAQILLIDYYQIIPSPDTPIVDISDLPCYWLDRQTRHKGRAWRVTIRDEAEFIQQQLNRTIQQVGSQYSFVRTVDITNLFNGFEMCTPASYLFAGYSKFGTSTAGHPTDQGHTLIADAILQLCATLPRKCVGQS